MSTLSESPRPTPRPRSAAAETRLRVVLMLEVRNGAQQRFLDAYDQLCHQVASVPGHVSDQLCQSIENPSQWLITSEWESARPFLSWVDSEAHREMVKPLHGCVNDTRSLRFTIMRETGHGPAIPITTEGLLAEPRVGDGIVRHALTFTVRPGSEQAVAEILAGYEPPESRVDDTTRLRRTSLFMRGNQVVRSVEVTGDLVAALRHVAQQPQVRAVEEALNPHLVEERDLDDPVSAREFFQRAALPSVHHWAMSGLLPRGIRRHALLYPVREGCGTAVATLLARQDELAAARYATDPMVVASTIFQRDDRVVRLIDVAGPLERRPAVAAGVAGPRAAGVLSRLVDLGPGGDLSDDAGLRRFLGRCAMTPITDRRASGRA
ncbi:SchA/CurD-like domain-containing protein [Streptomyces palmae]|uniref:TcmI family type II polyketide cyclase n=1 Tax=Streptomyces palmae TaxID=1701085 RepID=A0A4Z0GUW7_9ACTN|nr:SchA/CurD-like domain-containing protein [Streptomyces palmae]TGB00596.1 TcmI family type II polyketide cyclase [Streptomyces palmae]